MKKWTKYIFFLWLTVSVLLLLAGCQRAPAVTSSVPAGPVSQVPFPAASASPTALPDPAATSTPSAGTSVPTPSTLVSTATPGISVSNGQRIYNTSTSASGESITYTGGPGMMMQAGLTCAECHGSDGHGGTVQFMMRTYDVPNITWPELTGPDPDMKHPPYTEETLKRAITQGLDPGGSPLDYPMPRWQMSSQDLDDLVGFIKTLK